LEIKRPHIRRETPRASKNNHWEYIDSLKKSKAILWDLAVSGFFVLVFTSKEREFDKKLRFLKKILVF